MRGFEFCIAGAFFGKNVAFNGIQSLYAIRLSQFEPALDEHNFSCALVERGIALNAHSRWYDSVGHVQTFVAQREKLHFACTTLE